MSLSRYLLEFANENPGKTVGAVTGFILGILILTFGFLKKRKNTVRMSMIFC